MYNSSSREFYKALFEICAEKGLNVDEQEKDRPLFLSDWGLMERVDPLAALMTEMREAFRFSRNVQHNFNDIYSYY